MTALTTLTNDNPRYELALLELRTRLMVGGASNLAHISLFPHIFIAERKPTDTEAAIAEEVGDRFLGWLDDEENLTALLKIKPYDFQFHWFESGTPEAQHSVTIETARSQLHHVWQLELDEPYRLHEVLT